MREWPIWDEPRPTPPPPARVWRDYAVVAAAGAAVLTETALTGAPPVLALITAVTLFWRRTRPLLMVAIAFGLCAISGAGLNAEIFLVLLPYALFRWGAGREIVLGSLIMVARLGIGFAAGQIDVGEVVAGLIVLFGAGALGLALRYRARARLREREKIHLLERERLARDLHDTVAHHVSAMAIRAQAGLATAPADPESAVHALRLIESEASQALTEMRALVRFLREESPGLREVRALAGPSPVGPPVDVQVSGDVDDLSPQVASTLFRLAQESVTNARRHARDATLIMVRVDADETAVRLRVSDDGKGYGLTGMAERAELLGGSVAAGPGQDLGWTVDAVLPRSAA